MSPTEAAWKGIERCRQDDWQEGLYWLSQAVESNPQGEELPSVLYAYLGYGLARYREQAGDGLELCRHAVDIEPYQAENFYCLARVHLLRDDRRSAVQAMERGLQIDIAHPDLNILKRELGERRRPVLPFLDRSNPLNIFLGKIRHGFYRRRARRQRDVKGR